MPSEKPRPPAASPDLTGLLCHLREAGVELILVGGLAAVSQGAPVSTFDVDVVPRHSPENLARLLEILRRLHAHHRGQPGGRVIEASMRDLDPGGHALLETDLGPLDVLGRIEQGQGFEELLPRCIEIELRGQRVLVLSLEALVELKRASRRAKDALVLPILEEALLRSREK